MEELAQVTLREAVILVGDTVQIVGAAVRVPAQDAGRHERGYRDGAGSIPVFSAPLLLAEDREPIWIGREGKSEGTQ